MKNLFYLLLSFIFIYSCEATILDITVIEKTLLEQIKEISVIEVESTHLSAIWDDSKNKWNKASKPSKLNFIADINAKMFKVKFYPRIAIWLEGSAPFSESNSTSSFNGEWGVHYTDSLGPIEKVQRISPRAEITNDMPSDIAAAFLSSGKAFWLLGLNCYHRYDIFEIMSSSKLNVEVIPDSQRSDNDPLPNCILLQIKEKGTFSTECFWIDPKKGYALRRREYSINHIDGKPTGTKMIYDIKELQEIQNSKIFYPKSALYELYVLGKPKERHEIEIISVHKKNILEEEDFNLKLPEGTHVSDDRLGISFTIAGDEPKNIDIIIHK